MPQLSLYLDKETLNKVQKISKLENTSISKWVSEKITTAFQNDWPENYFNLFGSIKDKTFKKQKSLPFNSDADREKI